MQVCATATEQSASMFGIIQSQSALVTHTFPLTHLTILHQHVFIELHSAVFPERKKNQKNLKKNFPRSQLKANLGLS